MINQISRGKRSDLINLITARQSHENSIFKKFNFHEIFQVSKRRICASMAHSTEERLLMIQRSVDKALISAN